ncbi:MAG: hypothetical protein JHC64_03145 [Mycolicibacterium sp.]|nr:hypothetical protein [Mycolicibacterium sp.]
MGRAVEAAHADDVGGLHVTFEGGARIVVGPDPDYESWHVNGPNGALVLSMPGGGLAVWDPQPPD